MKRASIQRTVTLALAILDTAAYGSDRHRRDTDEVRLALAVPWCVLRDRSSLLDYWERARTPTNCPWKSCREPYYGIACSLRTEGWHAPVG